MLVGSNKPFKAPKQHSWVLWKTSDGRYDLGYTGRLIIKTDPPNQVWLAGGGKSWKYIFKCSHGIYLRDLDAFCAAHSLDRRIFTTSLQFGYPRLNYVTELDNAAAAAVSPPA